MEKKGSTVSVEKCGTSTMDQKLCPFCRTPSRRGCVHLALASDGPDFVRRCIDICHGHRPWEILCGDFGGEEEKPSRARERAKGLAMRPFDFTWIETAFCDKFLKHLSWFRGLDHEWRTTSDGKQGGLWALLWSKDPQLLWCELLEELKQQADALSEEISEAQRWHPIYCPICEAPCSGDGYCKHVAVTADDDCLKEALIEFADAQDLWDQLLRQSSERPDGFTFLTEFVRPCRSASVETKPWTGGAPGLSGIWTWVFTADAGRLTREIRRGMVREIEWLRLTKARFLSGRKRVCEPPSQEVIEQIVKVVERQGGALFTVGQGMDAAEPEEEDLEPYPKGRPSSQERRERRVLFRLARQALTRCKDEHELCLQALDVLKAFNSGKKSYRDLVVARSRLSGRATAAGVGGLPHRAANAAATLACFHACNPNLAEAIEQANRYFKMTMEFAGTEKTPRGADSR